MGSGDCDQGAESEQPNKKKGSSSPWSCPISTPKPFAASYLTPLFNFFCCRRWLESLQPQSNLHCLPDIDWWAPLLFSAKLRKAAVLKTRPTWFVPFVIYLPFSIVFYLEAKLLFGKLANELMHADAVVDKRTCSLMWGWSDWESFLQSSTASKYLWSWHNLKTTPKTCILFAHQKVNAPNCVDESELFHSYLFRLQKVASRLPR